jgi:hypothetical protein
MSETLDGIEEIREDFTVHDPYVLPESVSQSRFRSPNRTEAPLPDPREGFANRFYGASETFMDKLSADADIFGEFSENLFSLLQNRRSNLSALKKTYESLPMLPLPPLPPPPVPKPQTLSQQTQSDPHYYNLSLQNASIILNEKTIQYLERELSITLHQHPLHHRADHGSPSHQNFNLFIEYSDLPLTSPYLQIQDPNIVRITRESDEVKRDRSSLPQSPPVYYSFDHVIESYKANDVSNMINNIIQKVLFFFCGLIGVVGVVCQPRWAPNLPFLGIPYRRIFRTAIAI